MGYPMPPSMAGETGPTMDSMWDAGGRLNAPPPNDVGSGNPLGVSIAELDHIVSIKISWSSFLVVSSQK